MEFEVIESEIIQDMSQAAGTSRSGGTETTAETGQSSASIPGENETSSETEETTGLGEFEISAEIEETPAITEEEIDISAEAIETSATTEGETEKSAETGETSVVSLEEPGITAEIGETSASTPGALVDKGTQTLLIHVQDICEYLATGNLTLEEEVTITTTVNLWFVNMPRDTQYAFWHNCLCIINNDSRRNLFKTLSMFESPVRAAKRQKIEVVEREKINELNSSLDEVMCSSSESSMEDQHPSPKDPLASSSKAIVSDVAIQTNSFLDAALKLIYLESAQEAFFSKEIMEFMKKLFLKLNVEGQETFIGNTYLILEKKKRKAAYESLKLLVNISKQRSLCQSQK